MIFRLTGKHAALLAQRAFEGMKEPSEQMYIPSHKIMDWSLRSELIAAGLTADIYFAHPYSSWGRGINENTNGLIRQYLPKGKDFSQVTKDEIKLVMDQLNTRLRKTSDYKTSNNLFVGHRVDLLAA